MASQSNAPFSSNIIYLDYNATTPVDKEVLNAMLPYFTDHFGNASSAHSFGAKPRSALSSARKSIASLINVEEEESIIFTSGSTEAINHILRVAAFKQRDKGLGDHIITTKIEHPAVLETVKFLQHVHKFRVTYLQPDEYAMIHVTALEKALQPDTVLVSIMHANNEVGTINPIESLCKTAKSYNKNILFHSDTSQSIGKIHVYPKEWGLDFCVVAGHKIYAPKGIGAMYINPELKKQCIDTRAYDKSDIQEYNLLYGAKQENGYRPGTENIAYCVALGKAAELSITALKFDHMATIRYLRDLLYEEIMSNIPQRYHSKIKINGHPYIKLPNTLSISFGFIRNTQITKQIFKYVACSTGAACHSGDIQLSYVLEACGLSINFGMGTLRLSVGRYTTEKDVMLAAKVIASAVTELYSKTRFASKL
eukprot:CAMPEP_0197023744 /NCGR_PEP_ID=MMETSP1384-20130603/4393_1 /TAXON_ID=29189 /ORGANISM="Ammonia sp." /LENGTH=423 /DNA_ID=CAMNT_0042452005 /DNA_START=98 /DNA_END=1369 /DNA_ORIENTATION=+